MVIPIQDTAFERKHSPPRGTLRGAVRALFCLLIITACLTGAVSAAGIEGIEISGSGEPAGLGGNASYDAVNTTLTLNGGEWAYINVTGVPDLTILLNGTNRITGGCR